MSVIVTVRENGCETAATSIQCDFGIIFYFLLKLIHKRDLSKTTVLEANILDNCPPSNYCFVFTQASVCSQHAEMFVMMILKMSVTEIEMSHFMSFRDNKRPKHFLR